MRDLGRQAGEDEGAHGETNGRLTLPLTSWPFFCGSRAAVLQSYDDIITCAHTVDDISVKVRSRVIRHVGIHGHMAGFKRDACGCWNC